ncbi:MAG: DUF4388 domain-containing protein [Myxococcales bacterium]
MAKTALIIEDDEATGKLLATLCEKLDVECDVVKNGKDGFERAHRDGPDLLILDLLVPGMDGFKIADGLKAAKALPKLIVVSGVYKDPKIAKDFSDKFGAEFFQKPFKNDEMQAAIGRLLGLAVPEKPAAPAARQSVEVPAVQVGPMQGSLGEKPFASIVMDLFRAKASGTLDLTQGPVRKRIYFNRGLVRFAQSNVKAENVGGMQVAEGTLAEQQFQQAVARARAERIGIGEALALSGAISYEALNKATRRQVEEVCVTAFGWQEGGFQFAPGSTDRIQDARHDPIALLMSGYKRFVTPDQARARLVPLGKAVAGRAPEFDRSLFVTRSVFQGETLTPMVNGRLKIEDILGRARAEDLPLLLALVELELATLTGLETGVPKAAGRASSAGPSRPYTPEERATRDLINAEYQRVQAAPDLFGVLRLRRGASIEQVKESYLSLAKRFHADSFAGLELGEANDQLRELFAKISEAHSTLTDPKRRADYDVLLERKDAGLPTDMEVIFKAEAAYNRADASMKQGRFAEAELAVKEALKLDPGVVQYHVALGQALLKGRGAMGAAEAREALDKALASNPELVAAKILKASAFELEGNLAAAESLLREVLVAEPDNAEAMREYRALRGRSKKGDSKGLLGKLFKR